jgi:hypothetical protein
VSTTRLRRVLHRVRPAVRVMLAVLGALGTGWALHAWAGAPEQAVVLAVVLALTLRRVPLGGLRDWGISVVDVVAVTLVASVTGRLLFDDPWVGGALLTAGLSVGILARRYPPAVRRAGRLVGLPFVALLVTPAPVVDGRPPAFWWAVVAAGVALLWTGLVARILPTEERQEPPTMPAQAPRRRLDAPTRMAAQMALGVAAALLLGHLVFGSHWAWTVLSAFLVASGNRGRGDVVHKAGLRVVGALVGTVAASLAVAPVPAGHRSTLVILFVVLFAGLVLRERSYVWWAGSVTAMVALLHAYYGEAGASLLLERVGGVLLGSAIGVAVAWFVLPVRTTDVVRRRVFDCLAALTDDLTSALSDGPHDRARYPAALARLAELTPTLRSHRRLLARRATDHSLDAVLALHGLALPDTDPQRRRLRRDVVWVRRAASGREAGPRPDLTADLATVHRVLTGGAEPECPPLEHRSTQDGDGRRTTDGHGHAGATHERSRARLDPGVEQHLARGEHGG